MVAPKSASAGKGNGSARLLGQWKLPPRHGLSAGVCQFLIWVLRSVFRCIRHRGQFRLSVLRCADVSMDTVVTDTVDDHLDRLRGVGCVEHDRLIEIDVLLRQVAIVHHQFQVGILVLVIGFLQSELKWSLALELFRFREVKLRVVSLPLLLQQHQFVMGVRNRARQLGTRIGEVALRAR
jgi:hypothetical protein